MQNTKPGYSNNPIQPNGFFYFSRLLILFGLALTCLSLAFELGMFISENVFQVPFKPGISFYDQQQLPGFDNAFFSIQCCSQLIGFLLPALLFAYIYKKKEIYNFLQVKHGFPPVFILFFILLYFTAAPMLNGLTEFMSKHALHDRQLEEIEKAFIKKSQLPQIIMTLVLFAVLPAICEELIFRGALLGLIRDWSKNPHTAAVVSAAVFTSLHPHFDELPAIFLMGVALSYLYIWTGSIWASICAHFIFNSLSLIITFLEDAPPGKILRNIESASPLHIALSIIITGGLLYLIQKKYQPS